MEVIVSFDDDVALSVESTREFINWIQLWRPFGVHGYICKVWSQDCAKQIVHFRKRARTLFSYAYPSGVLMATLYWTWNACHNYNGTWRDVIIIAYIPVLSIMGNHGIGCIVFFITLSIRYFQMRQRALHSQLESFTAGLSKPSKRSNVLIWQRYCALNQDILRFNVELRAYSAYWSPYLSAIFGGYIALVSQLLYGALFQAHNMHFLYRSFFIFFAIEFMILLLVVTRECAIIVRNNIRIFKTNRAFCYAFTKGSGQPNARCRLQMSKAISNYRGAKNGFRLINNFLIDSKMYEIILFYMCSIYIVLINQEKAK